jgi:hypothetical protein
MSLGTSNRDGGKTSESGHLRALAKIVSGDVITGLNAVQRAAGINMSVDIQVGDAFVRRSDGTYAHPVFNDAVYNQVISAADGSNPRRDIVVIYVDYGQTPSTAVSNNINGVVKIKVVNGTPAGSPTDPNDAAIQSSVGAGNPWIKLARVRVPAGQTSISNTLIDDLRTMISNNASTVDKAAIKEASVDSTKVDFSTAGKIWWEELGRVKLGTAANSMSVSFTGKRYMKILSTGVANGGTLQLGIQFNGDASTIYNFGYITNTAATGALGTQSSIALTGLVLSGGVWDVDAEIVNTANLFKHIKSEGSYDITNLGNGYAPGFQITFGKWLNTSGLINRIDIIKYGGTGNYAAGSEVIVLGHD